MILFEEDFEAGAAGWTERSIESRVPFLSSFLGRFGRGRQSTGRNFENIPSNAESIAIEFDLYQFDDWTFTGNERDKVVVVVDSTEVDLGLFDRYASGTQGGISWRRYPSGHPNHNLGFGGSDDRVHKVVLRVSSSFVRSGVLTVTVRGSLNGLISEKSFGIDNFKLTSHRSCGCEPSRNAGREDFESMSLGDLTDDTWVNGLVDSSSTFTKFLGRYGLQEFPNFPEATFSVPAEAELLRVEFDFYEIDEWKSGDSFAAFVEDQKLHLGSFREDLDEGRRTGMTGRGVSWEMQSSSNRNRGFRSDKRDQIHHVVADVPQRLFTSGVITLRFESRVNGDV